MNKLTNEQLLRLFTSEKTEECAQAVEYLFKQSVKSFYFLLAQQGNKEPLMANLNHPLSGAHTVVAFPSRIYASGVLPELSDEDKEKVVTIEVASLYLISAIYHDKLIFAFNPLLTDLNLPANEGIAANKEEYLIRGFFSARKWVKKCQEVGLETLRQQDEDPLKSANLAWC